MDYKDKYNRLVEAVKVLQETNPSDEGIRNWVKDDVPELAESQDEKVREWVYNYFRACFPTWIHPDITCGEILDWLEKQGQKEYTFKSIPRLLDMIEPSDRAKAYCQKLIDTLAKEGYNTDAKIVEGVLDGWNGEDVPMAVMDEQKPATIDIDKMVDDYANNKERGNEIFGKPVPCMIRAYRQGLNDAIEKVVLKPAWSEEDDSMFQYCIGAVATNDYYKGEEKEQIYDWLKCLKQKLK